MSAPSLNQTNSYLPGKRDIKPLVIGILVLLLIGFLSGLAVGYQWGKGKNSAAPLAYDPPADPEVPEAVIPEPDAGPEKDSGQKTKPAFQADSLPPKPGLGDEVANYASTFLGTPYRPRGQGNDGFDCSGYIAHVFKNFGIDLPPSTQFMIKEGEEVSESEAQPGDLIFFTGTPEDSQEVGHAGIIVKNKGDDIKFIHSSSGVRAPYVKYDSLTKPGYRRRFMTIKRILTESRLASRHLRDKE
jgi:cell wall-associated NlpC family hydrolase